MHTQLYFEVIKQKSNAKIILWLLSVIRCYIIILSWLRYNCRIYLSNFRHFKNVQRCEKYPPTTEEQFLRPDLLIQQRLRTLYIQEGTTFSALLASTSSLLDFIRMQLTVHYTFRSLWTFLKAFVSDFGHVSSVFFLDHDRTLACVVTGQPSSQATR